MVDANDSEKIKKIAYANFSGRNMEQQDYKCIMEKILELDQIEIKQILNKNLEFVIKNNNIDEEICALIKEMQEDNECKYNNKDIDDIMEVIKCIFDLEEDKYYFQQLIKDKNYEEEVRERKLTKDIQDREEKIKEIIEENRKTIEENKKAIEDLKNQMQEKINQKLNEIEKLKKQNQLEIKKMEDNIKQKDEKIRTINNENINMKTQINEKEETIGKYEGQLNNIYNKKLYKIYKFFKRS